MRASLRFASVSVSAAVSVVCLLVLASWATAQDYSRLSKEEQAALQKEYEDILLGKAPGNWQNALLVLDKLPEGYTSCIKAVELYRETEAEKAKRERDRVARTPEQREKWEKFQQSFYYLRGFVIRDGASKPPRLREKIPESIVRISIDAVTFSDGNDNVDTVRFLGALGPKAKDALPLLKRLRDEGSGDTIRREAQTAMEKIQGKK